MQLHIFDDCITPTRHSAPWALPALGVLTVAMPFGVMGMWYMSGLWSMHDSIPAFLYPVVIVITIVACLLSMLATVGLCLTLFVLRIIVSNARRERLARFAMSRQARCRKAWQTIALTMRLTSLRAQSDFGGNWKAAWEDVADVRANLKDEVWNDKLDLSVNATRCAGPLVFVAMWSVLGFDMYIFFTMVVPWYEFGTHFHTGLLIPLVCMSAKVYYDYAAVLLAGPGHPKPDDFQAQTCPDKNTKWCGRCNCWKPPRAHHCRICKTCVLKMDHHCIFVNSCVGKGNYRNFVLLLADIVIASVLYVLFAAPQLPGMLYYSTTRLTSFQCFVFIIGFLIPVIGAALLGPFLWYHIQCVLRNETTLERMKREKYLKKSAKKHKINEGSESGSTGESCCDDEDEVEEPVSYSRSPMENFGEVCGMPPVWIRRFLEPTLCFLTANRCGKRKD